MPVPPNVGPIVVAFHTAFVKVPALTKEDCNTVEFNIVPVNVLAAAVTVDELPNAQFVPFMVNVAVELALFVKVLNEVLDICPKLVVALLVSTCIG